MQLSSQQTLPVDQQQAWEALNDVSLLQASIPGCEAITASGENQYDVAIMAAVGPVKARFKGKLRLTDLQPPTSYTMHFEGQGGAAGHGKGSAQVRLESTGPRQTVLHYSANASVGGKLAQIGSRLVDMAAQKMANDFFATFTARLSERHGAAPAAAAPAPGGGAWARFVAWLKRLFGA
jgi:carbon monoxide dehydrogenase subunit G